MVEVRQRKSPLGALAKRPVVASLGERGETSREGSLDVVVTPRGPSPQRRPSPPRAAALAAASAASNEPRAGDGRQGSGGGQGQAATPTPVTPWTPLLCREAAPAHVSTGSSQKSRVSPKRGQRPHQQAQQQRQRHHDDTPHKATTAQTSRTQKHNMNESAERRRTGRHQDMTTQRKRLSPRSQTPPRGSHSISEVTSPRRFDASEDTSYVDVIRNPSPVHGSAGSVSLRTPRRGASIEESTTVLQRNSSGGALVPEEKVPAKAHERRWNTNTAKSTSNSPRNRAEVSANGQRGADQPSGPSVAAMPDRGTPTLGCFVVEQNSDEALQPVVTEEAVENMISPQAVKAWLADADADTTSTRSTVGVLPAACGSDTTVSPPSPRPHRRRARVPAGQEVLWSVAPRRLAAVANAGEAAHCVLEGDVAAAEETVAEGAVPEAAHELKEEDALAPARVASDASRFAQMRRVLGSRRNPMELAERWVRSNFAHPNDLAASSVTYPNGVAVDLNNLADLLELPRPVTLTAHRAQLVRAFETGDFANSSLQSYRAVDVDLDGHLCWQSGRLQQFVNLVLREQQLAPLNNVQVYRAYCMFDQGRSVPLDARDCLCLVDALLRVIIHCAKVEETGSSSAYVPAPVRTNDNVRLVADTSGYLESTVLCNVSSSDAAMCHAFTRDGSAEIPHGTNADKLGGERAFGSAAVPLVGAGELPADVERWKPQDTAHWVVNCLGLPSDLGELMVREEIHGRVLLSLAESDLIEGLGIAPFGRRRQLLLGVRALRDMLSCSRSGSATQATKTTAAEALHDGVDIPNLTSVRSASVNKAAVLMPRTSTVHASGCASYSGDGVASSITAPSSGFHAATAASSSSTSFVANVVPVTTVAVDAGNVAPAPTVAATTAPAAYQAVTAKPQRRMSGQSNFSYSDGEPLGVVSRVGTMANTAMPCAQATHAAGQPHPCSMASISAPSVSARTQSRRSSQPLAPESVSTTPACGIATVGYPAADCAVYHSHGSPRFVKELQSARSLTPRTPSGQASMHLSSVTMLPVTRPRGISPLANRPIIGKLDSSFPLTTMMPPPAQGRRS
eukprot:TRINITY_DN7716_c0_g1_i2.p1 TRINITY_DN7716_c0_g1~~TRINITY_DN7716_c0_g1_i2.p1  ORF type:complete len:1078 (-),score=150.56 TRINITY_DN7716_c0_g1_i2:391-3624(-)